VHPGVPIGTRRPRAGRVVAAAAIIAVGLIAIKLTTAGAGPDRTSPAPDSVALAVASVPAATFDAVGAGLAGNPPAAIPGPQPSPGGKPRVLYLGAIFCPYCAAERWPLAVALARFGTFHGLQVTTSASNDSYPDTATLSFAQASYTSDYLSFTAVEQRDRAGRQRQAPTPDQQLLIRRHDNVAGHSGHPIPFVDFGGFRLLGAQIDPGVLKGRSAGQIAAALGGTTTTLARAVDGAANVLTATLCRLTGGEPVAVCTSQGVRRAGGGLPPVQ